MKNLFLLTLLGTSALFAQSKKWTIAVYLCADNNLESAGIEDFNEMESTIDTSKYNVFVLLDRIPGYDNSNGNWTDTRLYRVLPDANSSTIGSQLLKDCGELNMGDPDNIAWFMDTVALLSQTDEYWLVLWNHGDGWKMLPDKDVCFDDTDNDEISVSGGELNDALRQCFTILGENLGIISYDACLMGLLEVEYETKDYADVTMHSQETEPGDGYPYEDILSWLNSHPDATPQELATNAADLYAQSYPSYYGVTQSAVDMGPWYTRFYLAVDEFARELIKAGGKGNSSIYNALDNTTSFTYNSYRDLYDFARRIQATSSLPASLRTAAQRVMDLQGDGFIGDTTLLGHFESGYPGAHGITIYGPTSSPNSSYSSLYWVPNSAWHWFIQGRSSLPSEARITYWYNSRGDSIGYGDNIDFTVDLLNAGGSDLSNVSATISTIDPYVTVLNSSASYGTIASEATVTSAGSYVVNISPSVPQGHRISFFLDITGSGGYSNTTSFNIIATGSPVGVCEGSGVPQDIVLLPLGNPVKGRAEISFATTGAAKASLVAYDATGRQISVLYQGQEAGTHSVYWNPPKSGTYFLRLQEADRGKTVRLISVQ